MSTKSGNIDFHRGRNNDVFWSADNTLGAECAHEEWMAAGKQQPVNADGNTTNN